MDLDELRERRRRIFAAPALPKTMLFAPVIMVGVIALGFFLFKDVMSLHPPTVLFPVGVPQSDDGTVRFIPPEVTTHTNVGADAPEASVTADIVITTSAVLLDGTEVATITDGELKPEELSDDGLLKPLYEKLRALGVPPTPVPKSWRLAAHVTADRATQYKVLKAVGDTAQRAGFKDLGFETLSPPDDTP